MKRTAFNDGWQFRPKQNPFAELGGVSTPYTDVTLPHDALIHEQRDPDGEGAVAYFPAGAYQYRTTFTPAAGPRRAADRPRVRGRLPRRDRAHQRRFRGAASVRLLRVHDRRRTGSCAPARRTSSKSSLGTAETPGGTPERASTATSGSTSDRPSTSPWTGCGSAHPTSNRMAPSWKSTWSWRARATVRETVDVAVTPRRPGRDHRRTGEPSR